MTTNAEPRIRALSAARRWSVYGLATGLYVTGVAWLAFKYFVRVTDAFGFENEHPLQGAWMIAHAAFALPMLWLFGVLWTGHVKAGWRLRTRRPTGGTLWGTVVLLAATGYALYYVGSDAVRSALSLLHWVPGVAALPVFLLHYRQRRGTATPAPG